ncbi:MAG: hypothetical protein NTZ59_15350, partial [Bacteroidetes bacterium]|nr:hypothetical protein [Bacteroidota bacterium]
MPKHNILFKLSLNWLAHIQQLASLFTTEYGNYPTISLDAGVPQRLSMSDLAPYFNPNNLEFTGSMTKAQYLQQNKLPEGFYSFCFQAIEVNTNKVVSESTCSNVWISLSDPPLLNTPANASPITKSDPINILFNWTPRHLNSPNGAFNTDYEFQIKEIWDNAIDPQAAFQTAIPLYTTTTQATTLLYGPTQPVLIAGKRYAWRVRAKAINLADDRDDFKNNGYSDVFWFDYKTACPVPIGYSINTIDPSTVSLGWVNGLNITDYVVEYRQTTPALSPWVKTPLINTNPLILNNLVPSSNYEVKVASNCPGNILEYGITKVFTTPIVATNTTLVGNDVIKVKGKVSWAYYNKGELASTDNKVVTNAVGSVNNCNIPKDEQVVTKYNLPNAIVVVYKVTAGNKQEIGSGYSDAFGNYSINVPSNLAKTETSTPINIYYSIEVKPAKSFATIVGKLLTTKQTTSTTKKNWGFFNTTVTTYTTTLDAANSYDVTSFVKNFEYEPKITSNDMATAQQSSMSVDILLSKSDWDNSYSKLPINIGKTVKGNTTYNNQNYVILENITKGNVYKQLMQGYSYVAKINYQNGTSTYSVFNSPTDYCKLSECYNYPFFTKLTGVVTGGGITRNNATVIVTIKDADRIGKTSSTTTSTILTIRTNANGEYSFDSIPKLKPNSDVKIEVKDATIRKDAFLFTTKLSSSTDNSYNINLVNEVYTVVGYLTDQYKNPIPNALIEYDGNVLPNRTGKDGYYLLQVDSKTKSITFSANGFTTLSFTAANLGVSLTGQFWDLSTRTNNLEAFWSSIMEQISGRKYPNFNSENFGYTSGDLKSLFTKLNSKATDKLVGVYDLDSKVMTNNNEPVKFNIKLKGVSVNTKISFIRVDGINETPIASYSAFDIFNFAAPAGYYKFKIEPVDNNNVFVPFVGEFTSRTVGFATSVTPQTIVVNLTDGALLKGKITNLKTNSILDSATITAEGLPYKDSSNNLGEYKMYLPKNESIKLQIRRKGYNTFDTTIKFTNNQNVIDFKLLQFDKSYTPVYTIAGFKVELDKQLKDPNPNTY